MSDIANRYRRIADGFTARVDAVPAEDQRWERQSPCAGWSARDVARHLIDAHHIFFGLVDHDVDPPPSVDDDPAAAWVATRTAMESALADPAIATREYDGMSGRSVWEQSIDHFLTADVLIHTWDLARGLGIDDRLDPAEVHHAFTDVMALPQEVQERMRRPDVYGPLIEPPADADEQDRLLAFTGRDPRAS